MRPAMAHIQKLVHQAPFSLTQCVPEHTAPVPIHGDQLHHDILQGISFTTAKAGIA